MTVVTVLGGTGKTGSNITSRLTALGYDVRPVSRSTPIPFDWQNPATWPAAVHDAGAVYVIADESHGGVDRLGAFLALSRERGVQRVVLLSARDWIDTDREAGLAREQLVRESALVWTIIQPAWFAQNFTAPGYFADGIRQGRILHCSDGGRCPFVDARDIGAVATAALVEPGHDEKEYAISGPAAITMTDVAAAIGSALGREVTAVEVELDVYQRHLADLGYHPEAIHAITYLDRAMRAGELDYVSDGVSAATGHSATPFATFARDHADIPEWREAT
ncbi:MAG: NAD(P)H-binding protein [Tetrasphaera sp.]